MNIGFASYFPPEINGCGDVTFNILADGPPQAHQVTLYTTAKDPIPVAGMDARHIRDLIDVDRPPHDEIVTVVSNGRHAEFYAAVLQRHGGIAHLHDGVLNHVFVGLWMSGKITRRQFFEIYEHWYGSEVREYLEAVGGWWDQNQAYSITAIAEVIQYAKAVIVNSNFLRERVARYFPDKPCEVIEQRYYDMPPRRRTSRARKFRIGTFGFVHSNKGIDYIVEALSQLTDAQSIEFHIVGEGDLRYLRRIYKRLRKIKNGLKSSIKPGLSQKQFLQEMADVDLAIQLRHPTFGETSSVCQRLLFANIPMLVSDTGYYAGLPDFVSKVDVPHEAADIRRKIEYFLEEKNYDACIALNRAYSTQHALTQPSYRDAYFDVISRLSRARKAVP